MVLFLIVYTFSNVGSYVVIVLQIIPCPEWYYWIIKAFSSIRKENKLSQVESDNYNESCHFFLILSWTILLLQFLVKSQFKFKSAL